MSRESIEVQLPKNWIRTRLGEITEIVLGQSPPSSTYNEHGEGLPFYQGKLEFGKTYPTPRKWCSQPKKVAEKGDVLISVRAPVGPTNICPEKSCIGRGLAAVRGLGGIETFFILYLLRSYEKMIAGKGTGTTFSAISGGQLRGLEIPVPPLNEQHRIVGKVEELFSFLDAGVESLRKVQAQLKRYRQAVLKYAFEGKLTEEWRKTHKDRIEPAQKLLERVNAEQNKNIGKKYEVAIPKTNLVQRLPAEWDLAPLGNLVADSVLGIVVPISRQNKKAEGITYIKMNNITSNGDLDLTNIVYVQVNGGDINKYQLEKGDVLFNTRNSYELVGKTSIVKNVEKPMVFNNNIMRIRLVEGIDPFFVTYQMNSPTFRGLMMREKKATTNICALYKKDLFPLPIVVAPVAEQHKIVEEIERCISVVDETEKVSKRSFQQSERLRQSILRDAFEGKLVPQDPNDESADKLLESIKAECISNKKSKGDKQVELSRYVK